jgi:hypothetical protein
MRLLFMLAAASVLLLAACGQDSATPVATVAPGVTAVPASEVVATPRQVPTLYPTATPEPVTPVPPTLPPLPTAVTNTPIAFDQVAVEIHYRLPALELDRRLQGDVSGRLTLEDQTSGATLVRHNQSHIVLEMQQGLAQLTLAELPDDCRHCVWMAYELPLSGQAGSGWLQDVTLLASLDNFTAVHLGPHVPPDTWLALRRSATSYWVAHTVAVTNDGRLWRWLATEGRIAESTLAGADSARLQAGLAALQGVALADSYSDSCTDAARETLFFPGNGEVATVRILCPALALPAALLPLYRELESLLDQSILSAGPPAEAFTLDTLLYYQTAAGERLRILADNEVRLERDDESLSATWPEARRAELAEALEQAGVLHLPASAVLAVEAGEHGLILRGPAGVSGAVWRDAPPAELATLVRGLDSMVAELAGREQATPAAAGPTPTASPTPAGTPTAPVVTVTPRQ